MSLPVQRVNIRAQGFAHGKPVLHDGVILFSVTPQLIRRTAVTLRNAVTVALRGLDLRFAIAVHAQNRCKHRPLEPTDQQFMERRVVNVPSLEAADIGRPPWDPRQPHIQSRGELIAKSME